MLAMNYRGPLRVRIDEKPMPEILHPEDAVVRVTRSCICGSDLHLYNGSVPDTRVGMTFGHEFTGIVEQVGPEVQKLKVGDHVLVPFNIACGKCVFCQQELYGNCHESNSQATAVGGHLRLLPHRGRLQRRARPSTSASRTRTWARRSSPTAWTPTTPCCSPTWCRPATRPPRWAASRRATRWWCSGPGPVGIMAARCAWLFGAGRVIVIDWVEYRLEFARKYAPCEAYDFRSLEDPVVFLKKTTDSPRGRRRHRRGRGRGRRQRDADPARPKLLMQGGSATALHWAINSVKKGGIVSIVGVYGPIDTLVPIGNVVNKGLTIRANQASVKRLLPRLIEHVRKGHIDPKGPDHAPHPARAGVRGLPALLGQAGRLHQAVLLPPSAGTRRSRHGTSANRSVAGEGWGVDADPENDPTYPMKKRNNGEHAGYTWQRPSQQRPTSKSCIPTSGRT
jgi:threonine dehydrogenase-like Zn-dependent dehydrogenase